MKIIPFEVILFLSLIYLFFPFWLKLFRKINFPDFITYIWSGFFLGGLIALLKNFTFLKFTFISETNSIYIFVLYLSLFLFLVQLGNNINFNTPKYLTSEITFQILVFLLLNLIIIGGGIYFFVLRSDVITAIIFFLAFISINIGPLMMQYVTFELELDKEISRYIQLATLLDIFIITTFSVIHTLVNFNLSGGFFLTEAVLLIILLIVAFATFLNVFKSKLESLFQKQHLEYFIPFSLGLILVIFMIGIKTSISFFLLAIWYGIFLNLIGATPGSQIKNRFNTVVSILYPLPFIEIGRIVFMDYHHSLRFWLYLNYLLLALIGITFLFNMYLRIRGEKREFYFFSFFARGEISVIILWIVYKQSLISNHLFIAAVLAIVISTILSQFFLTKKIREVRRF
jgi:Kef-type K+ transport system membrane component KefB